MKTFVLIIVISFSPYTDVCFAQSLNYSDTISASIYLTPEEKLEMESKWLRGLIVSEDSITNLMATKCDLELKNQRDVRYAMFMARTLLDTREDTAMHVIANNLTACPYFDYTNLMSVVTKRNTFPVVKVIESAPVLQVKILRDYLVRADYLGQYFSDDEIRILSYLLVKYEPNYVTQLNPARFTGQALKNAQIILEWKE